jgi:hypothetical protein
MPADQEWIDGSGPTSTLQAAMALPRLARAPLQYWNLQGDPTLPDDPDSTSMRAALAEFLVKWTRSGSSALSRATRLPFV